MKLFYVKLKGHFPSIEGVNYNEFYVVADDPNDAYNKVLSFLDSEYIDSPRGRILDTITLLADNPPESGIVFLAKKIEEVQDEKA